MKNPNWKNITGPAFSWVKTLNEIMQGFEIPLLEGPLVYIASDYSGSYRGSEYFVITILMADLYNSQPWERYRREIRDGLLRDNRRMSYKALNDRRRRKALKPFLNAAGFIHGLLATFVIHNSISHIVTHSEFLEDWYDRLGLKGRWTDKQFEKMLRIANFVSILIGAMGKPGQNIYWISDEDDIFANETKQQDVALMMSRLGNLYIKHEPGELGVGTSKIDPGDRAEEDLVAVADLTAGAVADIVNNLSKHPNWFVGNTVAIASGLKPKTEVRPMPPQGMTQLRLSGPIFLSRITPAAPSSQPAAYYNNLMSNCYWP